MLKRITPVERIILHQNRERINGHFMSGSKVLVCMEENYSDCYEALPGGEKRGGGGRSRVACLNFKMSQVGVLARKDVFCRDFVLRKNEK